MKPRTKKQIEVDTLAGQLKRMDDSHIEKCMLRQVERTAFSYPKLKGYTCGVCGHKFGQKYVRCPHCHGKFDNYQERPGYTENFYEGQIDRIGSWIVERLARVRVSHKRGKPQVAHWEEVLQRWVPYADFAAGKLSDRYLKNSVIRATVPDFMSGELSIGGPIEIRDRRRCSAVYYTFCNFGSGYNAVPLSGYKWNCRIPAELRRRGLAPHIDEPFYYASLLMAYPHFETLVKCGYEKLYRCFTSQSGVRPDIERLERLWPSLKVALRGGLHTEKDYYGNAYEYLDFLDMVMDSRPESARNTAVILPDDFGQAMENARRGARNARDREEHARYDKILADTRKGLSNRLHLANENFFLSVLTSVNDFRHEGDVLHHCVYANGYYKKEGSLILSARKIDDPRTPVETIEIRLDENYRIAQCYGDHDHFSSYHDEILQLAQDSIPQIRKAMAASAESA